MELHEQINALTTENKQYKDFVEKINAEKIALDQLLVDSLKNTLNSKTEVILKESLIRDLRSNIDLLSKEKQALENKIYELNAKKVEEEIAEIIN